MIHYFNKEIRATILGHIKILPNWYSGINLYKQYILWYKQLIKYSY